MVWVLVGTIILFSILWLVQSDKIETLEARVSSLENMQRVMHKRLCSLKIEFGCDEKPFHE